MYTCHFWDNNLSTKCSITSIYGKHTGSQRKELWKDISDNVISDHLWIVGGDFNTICSLEEHQGLTTPTLADITDFKDCIEAIPLICPTFEGGIFTWSGVRSRGRIWRRLDRALVNPLTMNHFPELNMKHLSKTSSDHKPILLQCQLEDFKGAKPFRCQDFWFSHINFLKVVKVNWTQQPMIGGMRGLVIKLKGLKATLKNWSREPFGDIFEAVKEAECKAMKAQEEYEHNPVDILRSIANKAQADLIVATNRETLFWKQKANIKWMELGDQNSSFFHSYVKSRRSNLKIRSITDGNGRKKMEVEEIRKAAEDYFKQCKKEPLGGLKPFRFLDAWLNHPTFLKVVTDSWDKTNQHGGMEGLARKLKELKGHIKERNTKTFGNIFSKLKGAEQTAIQAQENFEKDPSPANREQENKAKAQLILATDYELSYWKQKANIKWMEEGDCNSKFFHAFVKGRRAKNQIRRIVDIQGKEHTDREVIHNMAIDYYNNLFNSKKDIVTTPVLDYLETVITQEDNAKLSKIPTAEEIREAVWSINPNSAPGPDGFNGSFFRAAWHIIQNDVISATQEFFIGINLPKSYGSTFLSLIPKIDNPKSFGDYRPISLSTFMSKVNTRILADRIQQLLPKIISSEQTGFQTGMGVDEQILLVEEMVHKIDSKIRGGNVIIKLDMAKAFDNLEWDYIQGILKKLGFSEHNQGLLLANLRGTHISIMINGSPKAESSVRDLPQWLWSGD
ncbi:unnamed protein product [Cuscuta campestris]|uniref:Reverse transcriptase domain-containing protein n=1 Tax=Cuscuta campestris TaxID=132261 RepID=A0A484NTR8_9ASTE|nr:unnamed protein product [Cuscuta campestris]